MKTLISLLKPGGLLFDYSTDAGVDTMDLRYLVGDRFHLFINLTHESVALVMKCGGELFTNEPT